jgi:hypothetical protein
MSSFAELSDGDSAKFLVRWRGRQEGPYLAPVIEAKLLANEIGLLHEIFYEGKWVTIRDYITEKEAMLRAGIQAREEEERRVREETGRQAKEREETRREELSAEERRRNAQLEPPQAQANPPLQLHPPTATTNEGSPGLKTLGALFLIAGLGLTGYFFLGYDTSVESDVGLINNFGLMANRQNGIIIGIGLGVVGAILLAIGARGKN